MIARRETHYRHVRTGAVGGLASARIAARAVSGLVLAGALFAGLAMPAQAQSLGQLQNEIAQLRQQVQVMQQGGGTSTNGAGVANITVRLSDLEIQMRELTGRVERVGFVAETLEKRLDKLAEDLDYRLRYLEEQEDRRAQAEAAGESVDAGEPEQQPLASRSGTLGTITVKPGEQQAAINPAGILPPGDARTRYNYAFDLLKKQDYARATQALDAFLAVHGDSELAPSASFWLGEAYYGRNDFTNAARVFGEGFQKYSDSDRAPDMLWKLGRSLAAIGEGDKACQTFALLEKQFPNIPNNLRVQVERSKNQARCGS